MTELSVRPALKLAIFDLDHTLLPLDSDSAWGQFTTQLGWTDPHSFEQRNHAYYEHYKAGTLDIHDYVRFATKALREQGPDKARAAHAEFMRCVITPAIRPEAVELLRQHREGGDTLIIITATNEFVTQPIAQALGVAELMAVELERGQGPNGAGWLTGEILGIPTFREGKVARLEQWLRERELAWDDVHITFYSDSINDLPLLEKADQPVATNPDDKLRAIARQRGWRILELFQAG